MSMDVPTQSLFTSKVFFWEMVGRKNVKELPLGAG